MVKRFLFVLRHAPHDGLWLQESIDMLLTAAAFDQQVGVLFLDDGVFALLPGHQSPGSGRKPAAALLGVLGIYDVHAAFVERESLQERGLSAEQLGVPVQLMGRSEVAALLNEQDLLVSC